MDFKNHLIQLVFGNRFFLAYDAFGVSNSLMQHSLLKKVWIRVGSKKMRCHMVGPTATLVGGRALDIRLHEREEWCRSISQTPYLAITMAPRERL